MNSDFSSFSLSVLECLSKQGHKGVTITLLRATKWLCQFLLQLQEWGSLTGNKGINQALLSVDPASKQGTESGGSPKAGSGSDTGVGAAVSDTCGPFTAVSL